jgi:hypothetical protein
MLKQGLEPKSMTFKPSTQRLSSFPFKPLSPIKDLSVLNPRKGVVKDCLGQRLNPDSQE